MIEVKGPNVFKGYWRMPEKTAAEFRPDGFFITGDLGKIDERGYVHIVGRGKDLVITGGFNVYPKEVEDEIDAIPGVFESAVIGVPHQDFGEGVTAVVVRSKEAELDEGRSWRRSTAAWRSSSCRSAWSWSTICHATPWARCRRTSCASSLPTSMRRRTDDGRTFERVGRAPVPQRRRRRGNDSESAPAAHLYGTGSGLMQGPCIL